MKQYNKQITCKAQANMEKKANPNMQTAPSRLDEARTAREAKYPGCMKHRSDNRNHISLMFSQTAWKVMYTTSAIESLDSSSRRLNRDHTAFLKVLEIIYSSQFPYLQKALNSPDQSKTERILEG